ncbi:MAG: DUF2490 domain-containing protein [Bacteroidales bacterium]|nr:DUF2490 domain-containing protein [Bacteroidales bacterium]
MEIQSAKSWPFTLFIGLFLLFSTSLRAQTDVKDDPEFGARISLGLDKKIVKGLHITLEEEARFDNNFSGFDRLQTTLGIQYKVHNNIKLGLGYAFIAPYSPSNAAFKNVRHRLMADITGTLKMGNWNLSLKERFQWTYRMGDMNLFQSPRNLLGLKSRLMLKYKGRIVEPYVYVEMRNVFNAPSVYAYFDGTDYMTESGATTGDPGWFLTGYNNCYVNRVRSCLGLDFKISKKHELNIALLGDYVRDKVIDANSDGTKLKSYTKVTGFVGNICASYVFSF